MIVGLDSDMYPTEDLLVCLFNDKDGIVVKKHPSSISYNVVAGSCVAMFV